MSKPGYGRLGQLVTGDPDGPGSALALKVIEYPFGEAGQAVHTGLVIA
jgi:hypothetical protein